MNILAVISYSSQDKKLIPFVIEQTKKVTDQIIVVSFDHFFDGSKDLELERIIEDNVSHVLLPWHSGLPSRYWHNYSRFAGVAEANNSEIEYDSILFIDSDEVIEGSLVSVWVKTIDLSQDYKLSHYWYYRDTCYQADGIEEGAVLLSKKSFESANKFHDREREAYSANWNYMASYKNKVLGHHYSWAKPKDMLYKKVATWGHNQDNVNWKEMLDQEFAKEFDFTCPFKPYKFKKVDPFINLTFNS